MSAGVFQNNVQGNRKFHVLMMYSNYAINISVIIGSMMATSTKTKQFISVTVLKIIFKWHTGKAGLWTLGLWTLGLCKHGRLDPRRMDSASLNA